jgi:hypothetical protein
MDYHEISFPLSVITEKLQPIVAPDADSGRKMLVARAALPLPPDQLVPALAFLTNDSDADVRKTAKTSLLEMPASTIQPVLSSHDINPAVLDRLARIMIGSDQYLQMIVLNRTAANDTIAYLGRYSKGQPLEIISQNQARLAQHPSIVQAIYFNPNARMATVSQVLEFAVRADLPIKDMPGYKEIVAAVLGEAKLSRPMGGADAEPDQAAPVVPPTEPIPSEPVPQEQPPQVEQPRPPTTTSPEDLLADDFGDDMALSGDEADLFSEFMGGAEGTGAAEDWSAEFSGEDTSPGHDEDEDDGFFAVLSAAMQGDDDDGAEESVSAFIADRIRDMNVSERVRVALMGNASARNVLIRDSNNLVSCAVLRNPGVNEREITSHSSNKNLPADILRLISNSREWTRSYQIKKNLICNPKTPAACAIQFLRYLREKDLKEVSKNRDVPPTISRMAARVLDERERKRKKK